MSTPHAQPAPPAPPVPVLTISCAAALRPALERASTAYYQKSGVRVEAQYGASGTLLSSLVLVQQGDLYLPADDSFLADAQQKALLRDSYPLARMTPVIFVPAGNPRKIAALSDLWKPGVRVACADPETASISRVTRAVLQKSGDWPRLAPHITVTLPTVTDVANAVKLGTVDAGIVWDAVARQYPEMVMIHVPLLEQARHQVALGVLTTSRHPQQAEEFATFLASPEGQAIFHGLGYETVTG